MKKRTIIIMTLILALALSACSSKKGADDSVTSEYYMHESQSNAPNAPATAAPGDTWNGGTAEEPEPYPGESYLAIDENAARLTDEESMLTFSLKVDTAAYTNVERYIDSGNLPPADAVRTEELINYFNYDEPLRFGSDPFAIYTEVAPSPFDSGKYMAFIRVKTPDIDKEDLPRSNLTFLIDTSGSMDSYDKLPLLKEAFSLLVENLDENDRVSIVTYAGYSAVVLDSVPGYDKDAILRAIRDLDAGGSTAGADGILTAYSLAEKNYIEGGNNRVILATDGDFNVGVSSNDDLSRLIQEKRDGGVYLSILGFGTGNIRDDLMETLSKDGNGNYAYINSLDNAKKVLVEELASNLFTVADDVKAQIEFNPENVKSYRLIGYENRALRNEDFANDAKDAGEIGVGTDVVILFELELASAQSGYKYQTSPEPRETQSDAEFADELFEVRIRYKDPGETVSKLTTKPVTLSDIRDSGSSDFRFASAVSEFGALLRGSVYGSGATARDIYDIAADSLGSDTGNYRRGFLILVREYEDLIR